MSMKFSDFDRHPLFKQRKIDAVLTYVPRKADEMPLQDRIPMVEIKEDQVEMDVYQPISGGMTPMVAPGTSTPIHGQYKAGKIFWEPAEFREKVQLTTRDVKDIRKIGSNTELVSAQKILARKITNIRRRMGRRMEWMLRGVLFDGVVTATTADGFTQTVPYEHPEYLEKTASPLWSNPAADPLNDVQIFVDDLNDHSEYLASEAWFPHRSYRQLTLNTRFKDWANNNLAVFNGKQEHVASVMSTFLGDGVISSQSSASLKMDDVLAQAAAAAATSLVLRRGYEVEVGDDLILVSTNTNLPYKEKATVSAVTKNADGTTTVTVPAITNAFNRGSIVSFRKYVVPLDRMLIMAFPTGENDGGDNMDDGMADMDLLETPIDLCSTLSHFPDLMGDGVTGIWGMPNVPGDQDPPRFEYIIGTRCLPRVHNSMSWSAPTVF